MMTRNTRAATDDYPLMPRERVFLAFSVLLGLWVAMLSGGCAKYVYGQLERRAQAIREDEYLRTVQIDVFCPSGSLKHGSGVRTGGSTVLTAKHVVNCVDGRPKLMTVTTFEGKHYFAALDGESSVDIARLDAWFIPSMSSVPLSHTLFGEELCAAFAWPERGRRCGELWPVTYPDQRKVYDLTLDWIGEHGNSGAGVWDTYGNLVGILTVLRECGGTNSNGQVCTAGALALAQRRWLAAP